LIAAAASDDGRVYVWDLAADPGAVWVTLRGHTSFVTSVAFSPDGARIAAGGADRTIRVWTFASGAAAVSLSGHTSNITSVTFSPDGQRLASTSADHTARLWDAATG
jgi:WD40 repeat protein